MSKPKIILHFGAHKTGTSLLQKFMRDRSSVINESSIFAISRSETNTLLGWGDKFVKNPTSLINRIDSISKEGFKYIVVSHENGLGRPFMDGGKSLYPSASELLEKYRYYLTSYDVHLVYYIRDTADFLESYYIQTVQEGSGKSFRKWLQSYGDCEYLSWGPLVEAIKLSNFNSFSIINFSDSIRQGQKQFIAQFFSTFIEDTVNLPEIDYDASRNISVGALGLKLLKECNKHVTKAEERRLLRKFFQTNFNNTKYEKPKLLSEDQKSFILKKYGEEFVNLTHPVDHFSR